MPSENHDVDTRADSALYEVYRQAHETRRKWETNIWQWGALLLALAALVANWKGNEDLKQVQPLQKLLLDLISLFVAAIFLNVWRARTLMKRLELEIKLIHNLLPKPQLEGMPIKYRVTPTDLDEGKTGRIAWIQNFSSTGVGVLCHAISVPVFLFIGIFVWVPSPVWIAITIPALVFCALVYLVVSDVWLRR